MASREISRIRSRAAEGTRRKKVRNWSEIVRKQDTDNEYPTELLGLVLCSSGKCDDAGHTGPSSKGLAMSWQWSGPSRGSAATIRNREGTGSAGKTIDDRLEYAFNLGDDGTSLAQLGLSLGNDGNAAGLWYILMARSNKRMARDTNGIRWVDVCVDRPITLVDGINILHNTLIARILNGDVRAPREPSTGNVVHVQIDGGRIEERGTSP